MRLVPILLAAAILAGCAGDQQDDTAVIADSAALALDPDEMTDRAGVPAGYMGRVDRDDTNISDVSYSSSGGRWTVRTGPAHILYSAADSASGTYTVSASFEQQEQPEHPEAFGIFVGGRDLDQPSQQYIYFLARHTGEYMIRIRDGGDTRNVMDWTANQNVPTSGDDGRGSYELAMQVGSDSVQFTVNDQQVAVVPRSELPSTDGIAGVRVNHNLHLVVSPLEIAR